MDIKQLMLLVYGNPSKTVYTLDELKALIGGSGSGGAVADDPDFKNLVGRVDEVETNFSRKIDLPVDMKEGDVLQYVGGKFIGVQPDQLAGGA
mgnify:CR=1 FL=1